MSKPESIELNIEYVSDDEWDKALEDQRADLYEDEYDDDYDD
jgi:hypothetical protein